MLYRQLRADRRPLGQSTESVSRDQSHERAVPVTSRGTPGLRIGTFTGVLSRIWTALAFANRPDGLRVGKRGNWPRGQRLRIGDLNISRVLPGMNGIGWAARNSSVRTDPWHETWTSLNAKIGNGRFAITRSAALFSPKNQRFNANSSHHRRKRMLKNDQEQTKDACPRQPYPHPAMQLPYNPTDPPDPAPKKANSVPL